MAKARIIIKRRKAVRNIRKITKVMQMIATARYQKAFKRAIGTRPYVQKIGELLASAAQSVRASGQNIDHPLLRDPAGDKPVAVLVLTSNRGLAGGYNGNVLRLAGATLRDIEATGGKPALLHVSGKKGTAAFRFQKREMAGTYTAISDNPKYAEIEELATKFMQEYVEGKIAGLKLVFMRFISAGVQRAAVVDVLPLGGVSADEATTTPTAYEFSPDPATLLAELIPTTVKITLFQAFIEAAVSEQIARMVAMKAATDAADKMGKRLQQEYNRARQSQITSELAELMGGVEAMK